MRRNFLGVLLITLLLTVQFSAVQAQSNLLQDPGFETTETYKRVVTDPIDRTTYFDVPPAWNGWAITNSPGEPDWKNRVPTGFPHTGLFKIEGSRSFHISRGFATFTVAVYQTVTVTENANVRGSARGFMERGTQGEPTPGGQFKVGIDPNGGSNPLDGAIIWSTTATNDDGWVQLSVDATANGSRATLFLYATQSDPVDPNGIYWDDASMTLGGAGGTSPSGSGSTPGATAAPSVPTPQPFANFVAPQAPQDDGTTVHIVREGDTFDAIAVAYGVLPDDMLRLNNLSAKPRFLQIGQRLIIRTAPPGGGSSSAEIAAQQEEDEDEDAGEDTDTAADEANTETDEVSEAASETDEVDAETEEAVDAAETDEPEPTSRPIVVTEAPPAPVTQVAQNTRLSGVCLSMFEDANQNRIREQGETLLSQGVITLSANGETVETYTTDGSSEPFCVPELAAGVYTAAAQPPDGYGLTTSPQLSVRIQAGVPVNASFGAAQGAAAVVAPADSGEIVPQAIVEETAAQNPLLQNLGLIVFGLAGFVLVVGLGTAFVLRRR